MIISKNSTPEQKEALRQALRQQSLQMAVRGAAPEDIQSLPEDFEPPSYSENTRPLYDGQLFPKITSADDLIANGYATPDGQPTEQGKMAISLKKVGALNDDYTLNNTGRMMLASQDDLLKEENIDLYREYKRLEFDEAPDVGIWDMAKGIAADLVKGANAIAENELGGIKDIASSQAFGGAFEPYGAEPLTPEKRAESRIRTEEAAKDLFVSSAGLMRAAATEIDKVAAKTMWDGMMQDYQVAYLEQKYDRDLADMEKVNTAEVADELAKVIGLSTQLAEGRQQAEELLGPEATEKAIEEGRAAGLALSVVNPLAPEALVARTGFAAARKGVSAAFKPISRKLLESEAKAAQALQASQRVTGLQGNLAQVNYLAQKAEQEAVFAERQADKYSRLGLTNRANDARAFADKLRTRGLEAGAKVQGLTDEIARASEEASKLAQDAAVADKINFIAQKAREIPGLPIQAIGGLVEGTGMAMIGIDKGLSKLASKIGADKAYNAMNKITTLSGLGTVASYAGLGPAAFIPAAIKTAWSTAPFLKGAGHFVRMIGKETANARELIPFWQRVANYETLGATQRAIAHLMDTSTLGSRVTGLAGDVAKGIAASYPVDLAFEWISEGGEMDMNTLKQAAAETVVFGGGGALGGITAGSKERIKKLQRGSALNFYRNIKDGGQRVAFNALNDGMKRSIGTYSAAFPNLNIRFTDQGGGAFDPASNTAFINPMSRNPLKPLLAHEINHYILIRNQMEGGISAALVGDGVQTGGLLRGKDGKLDENFLAFKEEYTRRLEAQHNRQINQKIAAGEKVPAKQRQFIKPTDNDIAIEYFVDSMADDMMEMAETGELGKQAGRMLVNRKMQAFGNAILQKAPIIKDFFYKLGGVTDQNGRAVYGNGLLAEGIREIPQMKKLFRQMISESAGRPMHVAKVTKGESEGHTIPITGKNDPILDEMTSMYESDENGVPLRDKNGDRIPLSDETERLRASSGLLLIEDQENRLNRGETLEDGELRFNPEENAWTGEYLTDRQIQILRASGRFNNAQMRQLEMLNGAAKENTGRRFLVFNQPTTKKRKGKRLDYETLGISMREIVPYGIKITKDGNILVRLMSVQQLHANAFEKAASKRGQSLYRGDVEAILRDVNQVIENHGRNEPTDAYFKREYGTEWEVRKNFINTVFGNVGKGQKDINPLLAAEKAKNAVVKTYRIDRINKATELEGRTKLPYQNHLVKVNFMPEGEPILDANGEPKDLRYTPRYEDRVMPEQRQMPEDVELSPEDLNPIANRQEAEGLFADGKRIFAFHEMDEKLFEITSLDVLKKYPPDSMGWMEPDTEPTGQMRFMPEKIDADYMKAVESGDVEAQQQNLNNAVREYERINSNWFDVKDETLGTKYRGMEGYGVWMTRDGRLIPVDNHSESAKNFFNAKNNDTGVGYAFGRGWAIMRAIKAGDYRNDVPTLYVEGNETLSNTQRKNIESWAKLHGYEIELDLRKQRSINLPLVKKDDSGNIITPSKRFDITSKDLRFMPEGEPKIISEGTKDALPVIQAVDKDGNPKFKDGEPVPQIIPYSFLSSPRLSEYDKNDPIDKNKPNYQELAYDIPKPAQNKINQAIDSGAVDNVVKDVVKRTRTYLKNPEIAAGMGWYSRMRVKLLNALGESGRETLSQLLGATSARTPVKENFLQAMDAYEGIQSGRYEQNRKAYIDMLQLQESGKLKDAIINRNYLGKVQSKINELQTKAESLKGGDKKSFLDEAKKLQSLINKNPNSWNPSDMAKITIIATDMLPRRSNGKKFNANSLAVLKVIHGSWLDNRNAPKTPNFAGNLSGRTLQATIDVWAARFLRAVLYEGKNNQWRIQPKAESAVSNEDFALGQIVFERAAKKLKMNPDDLQAVLWFAEKDRWDKMGWTKKVGAEKSSFDDIFSIFFPDKEKPLNFEQASAKLALENE